MLSMVAWGRNPLPCGDGLEDRPKQCSSPTYQVVILCRVDMGWKGVKRHNASTGAVVVILCRVDMGWKVDLPPTVSEPIFVVILCRVDMGWKGLNGVWKVAGV